MQWSLFRGLFYLEQRVEMSAFGGKADMPFCGAHVCF